MTSTTPKRSVLGVFLALGVVTHLVACETSEPSPPETTDTDAGDTVDTPALDAGVDASDADSGEDDDFVVPDASVVCGTGPCAVAITGHGGSFCVVLDNGKMACWGSNTSGELGYDVDGASFSATPRVLGDLASVTSASVGDGNACARVESGDVLCWGAAELVNAGTTDGGGGLSDPVTQPTRVTGVPAATSVAVGTGFACATASDGALWCWGKNASRELGRGPMVSDTTEPPAEVQLGAQKVATVVAGAGRAFAMTKGGDLLTWGSGAMHGRDSWGRPAKLVEFLLGRDISDDPDGVPTLVPGLAGVRSVATSTVHACGVVGRDVYCWGSDELGQLGRGTFHPAPTTFQLPPSFLPDFSNLRFVADADRKSAGESEKDVPIQVAVADEHSCAVMGSGRVYCWGKKGDAGVLGAPPTEGEIIGTPTRIDGLSEPAVGIASAGSSVCALLRSGAVECWGSNGQGQLGTGTADELPHPSPSRVVLPN